MTITYLNTFLIIIILLSIIFFFKFKYIHPINLISIIISYTIIISISINSISLSSWYSYILFISIIRGIIILFIYFIVIKASDSFLIKKQFYINLKNIFNLFIITLLIFKFFNLSFFSTQTNSFETIDYIQNTSLNLFNLNNSIFLYSIFSYKITLIIICYLILIIFISTKICLLTKKSLRFYIK